MKSASASFSRITTPSAETVSVPSGVVTVRSAGHVHASRTISFPSTVAVALGTGFGASGSLPTMLFQLVPTRTSSKSRFPHIPYPISMIAASCGWLSSVVSMSHSVGAAIVVGNVVLGV